MLWRTKLRSTLEGIDHAEQVDHCVRGGLIGIGWRMDELGPAASIDDACDRIENTPGWGRVAAQTVRRFGAEAEIGDSFGLVTLTAATGYAESPATTAMTAARLRGASMSTRYETPSGHRAP